MSITGPSTASPNPGPLSGRPNRGIGSYPVILVGVVLVVVGFWLTARTAPCPDFHLATQFSGSNQRLARWIGGCRADLGAARATLGADVVLIAGYVLVLAGILRRWWPLYRAPWLKTRERLVVAVPLAVGALDLVENATTLLALGRSQRAGGFRFTYPDNAWLPTIVSTSAWLKTIGFGVAVLLALMAIGVGITTRRDPVQAGGAARAKASDDGRSAQGGGIGVCCSGGGIRSAAYSLGAIAELERAGVMSRARWLSAVSGGNYAATAWTLARAAGQPAAGEPGPSQPDTGQPDTGQPDTGQPDTGRPERQTVADEVLAWLRAPIRGSSGDSARHRYLRNGPGGLARSVIAATFYIAFNLAVLAALVAALAWPVGRLVGSPVIAPSMRTFGRVPSSLDMRQELWLPGVALIVLAGAVLLVSALPSWRLVRLWRIAGYVAAAGLVVLVLLAGIPQAMVRVGTLLDANRTSGVAATWGSGALAGSLVVAWRIVRQPVLDRVRGQLPKLGGVLLAAVALFWGGKVATDAATASGVFASPYRWLIAAVVFVVVYLVVPSAPLSLHRIYRRRLLRTFGLRRRGGSSGELYSPGASGASGHLRWDELALHSGNGGDGPELVVCCAQQRNGFAPGGLPADTFSISASEVRIGDDVVPTATYLEHLPASLADQHAVAAWTAASGAAFASAMGRFSQGSTNALLAALNIDLGIWLPNPRLVAGVDADADGDAAARPHFPMVRYGYLLKEILGWYDAADRYVFVADGGHWDNLGLVELLRRRCELIICLDAGGDPVGRYASLHHAVELAGLELAGIVDHIDVGGLAALEPAERVAVGLPATTVAELTVHYCDDGSDDERGSSTATSTGRILFARSQLAADLDVAVRRYAKSDPKFPNYSTANQFLSDKRFDHLVDLGRESGRRVVELLGTSGSADRRDASDRGPVTVVD